jgi:hypothetical protein
VPACRTAVRYDRPVLFRPECTLTLAPRTIFETLRCGLTFPPVERLVPLRRMTRGSAEACRGAAPLPHGALEHLLPVCSPRWSSAIDSPGSLCCAERDSAPLQAGMPTALVNTVEITEHSTAMPGTSFSPSPALEQRALPQRGGRARRQHRSESEVLLGRLVRLLHSGRRSDATGM